MRPPVEHVRVSMRGKELLLKVKKRTGLDHWNELCRVALCRSLANPIPPAKLEKSGDVAIDMEWKTFAGEICDELACIVALRASIDKIDITKKEDISEYFRAHLERGITSLHNITTLDHLYTEISTSKVI